MTWEEFKKWEEFKNDGFRKKEANFFEMFDDLRNRRGYYARITGKKSDTVVTHAWDIETNRTLQIIISEENRNEQNT